jgi:hypothetical protein
MRVLRDPGMGSQHAAVVSSLSAIFKALGTGSVPYLPKVGGRLALGAWCRVFVCSCVCTCMIDIGALTNTQPTIHRISTQQTLHSTPPYNPPPKNQRSCPSSWPSRAAPTSRCGSLRSSS